MYKTFFELSTDLLCIANPAGYFVEVNSAFSKLLGYSKEELKSKPFLEFVHPEDLNKTLKELENQTLGIETNGFENRYQKKDGSYVLLSWRSSVSADKSFFYAIARDITENRTSENKLKAISEALRAHSIIAITDTNGNIIEVNDEFCRISKYTREELIGQNHRLINSGDHPKEFFKEMWQTISNGRVWIGMIKNRAKDGTPYFVHSVIFPIIDALGEITQYMAIRFDMSSHMKLQQNLKRTLDILNETGAIAKVGGWELIVETGELNWTDETFHILEVEKTHGQKPVLAEGLLLFTPRHQPIIEEAVKRAIEYGEPYSLELEAQTAKGNIKWVYTNGRPNYIDGKIYSLSGTIQDIHEIKLAQEKLEEERFRSMQQSRLASLGEISAGIAHEINNPLTVISGNLALLNRYIDDKEKFNHKIATLQKSCTRIEKIVKNLQKFVRTDSSSQKCNNQLSLIIPEAIELTNIKAKKYDIEVSYLCDSEQMVFCDELEIEQVLVNLISNAIDASRDSQEKWIKIHSYDKEKNVIIDIIDSGPGVPEEIKDKLFDPFFTTKAIGEGTGLGLSISKTIVENNNGHIKINKKDGHNCFRLEFPSSDN